MSETAACLLRLDTDNTAAAEVARFVAALVADSGLSRRKAYWLRLAAEEITTNIAYHGYKGDGPVRLEGRICADAVMMRIEDEAPPFDPTTHDPRERLATDPAEREAGGFGLLLALHNLDDFSYAYIDGKNRNELIMYRTMGEPDGDVDRAGRG